SAVDMNAAAGGGAAAGQGTVLNSFTSVSTRYAAGTMLQTGPGVPAWNYNDYQFGWSGPVEPSQTLRFVYLGPVLLGIWRILAVLSSALLTLLLARAAFNLPF